MKKNYTSFLFGVITTLLIAVCGYFGYNFYKDYKKNKTQILQEIKLKPLTSEEIFNRNQDAVVLIKHTFVYKINALGDDFYFNDYNSQTGEISKLMPFLHLPVQSGSDSILRAMNRKHGREEYFKTETKVRTLR